MFSMEKILWELYNQQHDGREAILAILNPVNLSDSDKQEVVDYIQEGFLSRFFIRMKITELLQASGAIIPSVVVPLGWQDIIKSSSDKWKVSQC